MSDNIHKRFEHLADAVAACRICPTMEGRRRVFSVANGKSGAVVLFVAEAPGRFGGERTGVPLTGDQTGKRFERLLAHAALDRAEVFITNAVLCNPRDARGNNRRPSTRELDNCRRWLGVTLETVAPRVVVALGATALSALARLEPHGLSLRADVGRPLAWCGRWLVPLYHPSPRAGLSRPYLQQDADFRRLGEWLRRESILPGFDWAEPRT